MTAAVEEEIEPSPAASGPVIKAVPRRGGAGIGDEIGASGLKQTGGYLYEEFVRALQQTQRAMQLYREMRDNSALIGGVLLIMKNAMRQVPVRIEPFVEEGKVVASEDEKRAQFVEEAFGDLDRSESELGDEIRTFVEYGFAPMEIVYKKRLGWKPDAMTSSRFNDGAIGWARIALRGQESVNRWQLDDENGDILGMYQMPAPSYRERLIPIDRLLLFRTTAEKNNPQGRSMLRNCYFEWLFIKRLMEVGGIGAERDLTGLVKMTAPGKLFLPTANTGDKLILAELKKIGQNVRNDEQGCVLIPSDVDPESKLPLYSFELVASPGTRQFDVGGMIEKRETRMAMALASDFVLLGHEKVGSFALGKSKTDIYALVLDALLDAEDDVWNRQAIPRLAMLNGWPMDRLPRREHASVTGADVAQLAELLKNYTGSGGMLDPELDKYVREQFGWPEPEEVDTGISTGVVPPGGKPPAKPATDAEPDPASEEQDDEEDDADDELDKRAPAVNVTVNNVLPGQEPPTVTVEAAKVAAPDVHVHHHQTTVVEPTPVEMAVSVEAPNVTVKNEVAAAVAPAVIVNVAPTPVTVENEINVPAASVDVNVNAIVQPVPTKKDVKYDAQGRIDSVTEYPMFPKE